MFFIAVIASKGRVAAVLKVFYLVILLKLSCTTIKNLICAMLPDSTVHLLFSLSSDSKLRDCECIYPDSHIYCVLSVDQAFCESLNLYHTRSWAVGNRLWSKIG